MPGEPLRLGNEYATVEVSLDESANGPRVRIVSSGTSSRCSSTRSH
jgi:hypothetical protein